MKIKVLAWDEKTYHRSKRNLWRKRPRWQTLSVGIVQIDRSLNAPGKTVLRDVEFREIWP